MKHVITAVLFKAACSLVILILFSIGFIYATRSLTVENGAILYFNYPDRVTGRATVVENLGFRRPWYRDLWPFDRQMYSGW
jgi:hypothetical protein